MTETEFHKNLQTRALKLWNAESVQDARSANYAAAEERAAAGTTELGSTSKSATRWMAALFIYENFWSEHQRTPRENTRNRSLLPAVERRLGEWGRYQRRFEEKLCRYQVIRLDLSPAFAWDPQDHVWQGNFDACTHHYRATGRLPFLNGSDLIEFALARWLGRQLRQMQDGVLEKSRAVQLAVILALRRDGMDS
jgi:hypothetical protein